MSSSKLELWLHALIEESLENDASFHRTFRISNPGLGTRGSVDVYRDFHLRRTLHYAYEKSSFYRKQFETSGLRPEEIEGFEQLSSFPLTGQDLLSRVPDRFLCTSQSDVARPCSFVTSGTSGPPKKVYWSHWDIGKITDFMAAGISTVATPADTVQILLPYGGPDSQADLLRQGVEKMGGRPVVSGMEPSAQSQMETIGRYGSTVLFGYASHIIRISKELQRDHDLSTLGIRVLFLAGEYLPAARRAELESTWNCSVRTHYGLTEMGLGVAVECDDGDGFHFNEADLLLEIIRPETGERVLPGEEGELVFTTLTRQAMPLIRYRTRDISRFVSAPCRCGAASLKKIGAVKKRMDAIVKLANGAEIYPTLFDDRLFAFREVIDYGTKLFRERGLERLEFTVETEGEFEGLKEKIRAALHQIPAVSDALKKGTMDTPVIRMVPRKRLNPPDRVKKLILDAR